MPTPQEQQISLNRKRKMALDYLGNKCVSCGSTERLEFDHIDPSTKSFSIKARIGRPWEVTRKELDKCQILCYSCHKDKHKVKEHGTLSMHRYCKCNLCMDAKANYMKEYMRKRRAGVV